MASTSAATLPSSGTYPVRLASSLFPSLAKKRKRDDAELVALKYTFKPASMNNVTDASIITTDSGSKMLRASTSSHGTQAFDIREEQSKARECVLVYDPVTSSFTLHALPCTAHLTLNRSGAAPIRASTAHSETSSTSSSSLPLAQRRAAHTTRDKDDGSDVGEDIEAAARQLPKRRRPSEVPPTSVTAQPRPRPTTGGKGLPRKTAPAPAAHAAIPDFSAPAKAKTKNVAVSAKKGPKGAAAGKKKAPPVPQGKFKSAEIIEDSEEEYDLGTSDVGAQDVTEDTGGDEDEDDFAKMLGESLAEDADDVAEDDDDDEEEEEDDDEEYDEVLEGARFAPRQSKNSTAMTDEAEEWL